MTDTKNPGDKTLHVAPKTLSLKRPVEQGTVRQSFSHGRTKAVVVETVKRRPVVPGPAAADSSPRRSRPGGRAPARRARGPSGCAGAGTAAAPSGPGSGAPRSGVVLRTLSDQERDARANALADARRPRGGGQAAPGRGGPSAAPSARPREAREREAAEARKHDEEERRRQEDERKRRAEDEARRRLGEEPRAGAAGAAPAGTDRAPAARLQEAASRGRPVPFGRRRCDHVEAPSAPMGAGLPA